jgi:hypothetical protein
MPWGAILGAVAGPVIGGMFQSDAVSNASDAQSAAAAQSTQLARDQYNQTRADQAPYRQAGYSALDRLQTMLGLNGGPNYRKTIQPVAQAPMQTQQAAAPMYYGQGEAGVTQYPYPYPADGVSWGSQYASGNYSGGQYQPQPAPAAPAPASAPYGSDYVGPQTDPATDPMYGYLTKTFTGADLPNDPGYQFGLTQGSRGVERSASAAGGLYSGATLKALQKYGQDYAGTKFNEAFNRDQVTKNQLYNQLSGVSGTGQIATNQVGSAGQAFSNTAGNNAWGAGNASAAGSLARGNIIGNTVNNGLAIWQRNGSPNPFAGVGSGSTFFNNPTDPSSYGAVNGSDFGWYPG